VELLAGRLRGFRPILEERCRGKDSFEKAQERDSKRNSIYSRMFNGNIEMKKGKRIGEKGEKIGI
jgi:hypothetical protein